MSPGSDHRETNVLRAGWKSPPAVIASIASARQRLPVYVGKVSRPGEIPGPTVIVRMKENARAGPLDAGLART